MNDQVSQLNDRGFVWIRSTFPTSAEAFDAARTLIERVVLRPTRGNLS